MPPYLANAKTKKFVLSNSTTTSFLSLGPTIDYNRNSDVISDFKVQPPSTYFTFDSNTYTLSYNLKELL
jgi:hypothetical protein